MRRAFITAVTLLVFNSCTGAAKFTQNKSERVQIGVASFYGPKFHGRKTASGEIYNMFALTAAHPTLPFGTIVKVTNLKNKKSVIVRINDRGPFKKNRIIDLSYEAAKRLGFINEGTALVKIEVIKIPNEK